MSYALIGVTGIAILSIVGVIILSIPVPTGNVVASQRGDGIITGTTDPGDVAIELTPLGVSDDGMAFDVKMNTHSVDLSQHDLTKQAFLVIGERSIQATTAPALRGHHVYGTLLFPVTKKPDMWHVVIKNIPAVEERIYSWGQDS